MKNDTIFSKSILCACALFGFSSATAMPNPSKVVFVGPHNSSFVQRVANKGASTLEYTIRGDGRQCAAQLWGTASQTKYAPIVRSCYRDATQFVIVFSTLEELEHYFLQVFDVDDEVGKKAIVVLDKDATNSGNETSEPCFLRVFYVDDNGKKKPVMGIDKNGINPDDYDEIMPVHQLPIYPASLESGEGVDEIREAIATRCLDQR
jgi:hypothetical protein